MRMLKSTFTVFTLSLALLLTSCQSNPSKNADKNSLSTEDAGLELNGSSDEGTAGPLKTVYFDFNSSELSSGARTDLENNARWLKLTDSVDIQVEGHADERGGHQYNLALGERRARTVRDYLVALGVNVDRISIISYGKEKPVAFGHDEDAWGKNRRANFVVTAK